jgi:hypothetical protein
LNNFAFLVAQIALRVKYNYADASRAKRKTKNARTPHVHSGVEKGTPLSFSLS